MNATQRAARDRHQRLRRAARSKRFTIRHRPGGDYVFTDPSGNAHGPFTIDAAETFIAGQLPIAVVSLAADLLGGYTVLFNDEPSPYVLVHQEDRAWRLLSEGILIADVTGGDEDELTHAVNEALARICHPDEEDRFYKAQLEQVLRRYFSQTPPDFATARRYREVLRELDTLPSLPPLRQDLVLRVFAQLLIDAGEEGGDDADASA
jgi:hypothetical protein